MLHEANYRKEVEISNEMGKDAKKLEGFPTSSTLDALHVNELWWHAARAKLFSNLWRYSVTKHFLEIKRPDACIQPTGCYVLLCEGLLERWPGKREEVSFADACAAFWLPD
jgi:hypothetical protein